MPAGRPPKYENVEQLQVIVDKYFAECDPHWVEEEYYDYPYTGRGKSKRRDTSRPQSKQKRWVLTEQEPYTMAGLAWRLGLSRQGLMEYKNKDDFSDTIKAARNLVGEYNERQLHKGRNVAGAIFNLKVNFQFKEEVDDNPPPENPIVFVNNVNIDGVEPPAQPQAQ